ncbi:MAG: type II toxin-antitoxin system PemK/MazF family toxin [bacterium]|nr:type II toxin-antitoxin system PemK/MazF family toxin [bacterium]
MEEFYRGSIYYADLDPGIGSEQSGIRPVLVVQNDIGNINSPTTIIAPLTDAKNNKNILPTHIKLKAMDYMKYDSIILLEQIRAIDKGRLKNFVSILSDKKMGEVNRALQIALDLTNSRKGYDNEKIFSGSKKNRSNINDSKRK